jgi:PEGA domain-containing protein
MGFLRRVGLSRPDPEVNIGAAAEASGLDAFGTEETMASPGPEAPTVVPQQASIAIAVLAALVLIEAVPTALWMRARLRPPAVAEPVAAAALPATGTIPLASCESTPGPSSGGAPPAAPAPAPTSGVAARGTSAARRTDAVAPVVPPVDKSMLAGSIAVSAPLPLQVLLRGRVVATTEAESFMLPVGTHELEFVNEAFGYSARRAVTVQAGKTAPLRLQMPLGTVNINAMPWAEVWLDGKDLGETPLGNVQIPIGSRELVFRHPDLGERRATVLVTLKEPARISIDLRKK